MISVAAFTSEWVEAGPPGWVEEGTEQPCCLRGCLHSSRAQKRKHSCSWEQGGTGAPPAQEEMNLCITAVSCCFWCLLFSQMNLQAEPLPLAVTRAAGKLPRNAPGLAFLPPGSQFFSLVPVEGYSLPFSVAVDSHCAV